VLAVSRVRLIETVGITRIDRLAASIGV